MLVTSCDKLLTRNGSTANQHLLKPNLFAFRRSSFSSKLSNSNRSNQPVAFSTVGLRSRLLNQNGEQLSCLKQQVNSRQNFKLNSVYFSCKRHYKYSSIKHRFAINPTVNDFVIDKQIVKQLSTSYYVPELDHQPNARKSFNRHKSSVNNSDQKSNPKSDQSSNQPADDQQAATGRQDYTDLINVRSIYRNNLLNQSDQSDLSKMTGVPFKPKRALILTKFSRLEYERRRLTGCTEDEVKDNVS